MISQEVREFGIKPVSIAQLDGEFLVCRQLLEKRYQTIRKLVAILENTTAKKWELKNDRSELLSKNAHRVQELSQFGVTVENDLVVSDRLRDLDRENEGVWRFRVPSLNGIYRGARVERRVH